MNKDRLLKNQDFFKGHWLLVDHNRISDSSFYITDPSILSEYQYDLAIEYKDDDLSTTCDGEMLLLKDGKLVHARQYLSNNRITISRHLKTAFKPCKLKFETKSSNETFDQKLYAVKKDTLNYIVTELTGRFDSSIHYYRLTK